MRANTLCRVQAALAGTPPRVQACWPGPAQLPAMLAHPLCKAMRTASAKLAVWCQRASLSRALAKHDHSAEAMLRSVVAAGWTLPDEGPASALAWCKEKGVWKQSIESDAKLLQSAVKHGIDTRSPSRADGAPCAAAVLDLQARST